MAGGLTFTKVHANFEDRYSRVSVYEVSGPGFSAFVYQCRLNLDLDGAPKAYGYDNPAANNSAGGANLQRHLDPLESWHKGEKGVLTSTSQRVGLGNACGDPGDGTKGWQNFLNGNRKFYWAGIKGLRKAEAAGYVIDDRAELEAGLDQNYADYFQANGRLPNLLPKGSGYFPVVQKAGAEGAGYYISTTSVAADGDASVYDASHYLDSTRVPYAVWANEWGIIRPTSNGSRINQGDYGIAIRTSSGAHTGYIYGDSGTPNKVGECSQKLHDLLGSGDPVTFIAFPGSGTGRVTGKRPGDVIQAKARVRSTPLGDNASDLAIFMATGVANPKSTLRMTAPQARAYNNTYAALASWTNVSMFTTAAYGSSPRPRFGTL
jgi:hypothetical protein